MYRKKIDILKIGIDPRTIIEIENFIFVNPKLGTFASFMKSSFLKYLIKINNPGINK